MWRAESSQEFDKISHDYVLLTFIYLFRYTKLYQKIWGRHFPGPLSSEEAPNEPRCAQGQLLWKHDQKRNAEITWFAPRLGHSRSCWLGTSCLPRGLPANRKNERPEPHYFQVALDSTDISLNNVKERRKPLCYVCLRRADGSNEEVGENHWRCCKRNWKFMNHEIEMQPNGNYIQCGSPWEDRSRMRCGPKQCIWHALTFYRCFFLLPSLPALLSFKILKNLGPMVLSLSSVLIWIWQK